MPAAQVEISEREGGGQLKVMLLHLPPPSRVAGRVAAHRSLSLIFGNTNASNSGDTLSPATHREKKWQNLK